ncbi:putative polyamine transporter 4 [Cercophora newfieldiana]|uniref:Polyamine transporter 4 n=1 Tax=Cercophora newfieldiana TaxID=92897 RepID=A0AA40CKH3_9PEZI|nr:putative polyamine transporter 4 [Cercophora newfieldiana]
MKISNPKGSPGGASVMIFAPKSARTLLSPNNNVILDWDGPNDPDDPMGWPVWKKILHSAIPAIYSFGLATCISTFVAAIPFIMRQFDVSRNVALLSVSLYTFGFVLGPCIFSPISELYGRKWVYWTNFPMLVVFNAIAVVSDNFGALLAFRFLAGLGGSGVLAVGAGTLSDLWNPQQAGRVAVGYILAPFLGPSVGPLIGAYALAQYGNDWKWAVWVVLCILAPVGVAILFMEETSKRVILERRARKVGKAMLRPLYMCAVEPLSLLLGLYTSYSFAMVFSFFWSYAYVYSTVYHFDPKQIGLCYIAVVVGFLFAIATFGFFDATKYQPEVIRTNGRVAPEYRLYSALFGCWLAPIGLFWYAWAPRPSVHWIVPTYGVENSASAVAANGMLRFTLSAVFPLFIIQVYEGLDIHWAGTIFAFISVAFIPVPWVFFWKGKELRRRSKFATNPN